MDNLWISIDCFHIWIDFDRSSRSFVSIYVSSVVAHGPMYYPGIIHGLSTDIHRLSIGIDGFSWIAMDDPCTSMGLGDRWIIHGYQWILHRYLSVAARRRKWGKSFQWSLALVRATWGNSVLLSKIITGSLSMTEGGHSWCFLGRPTIDMETILDHARTMVTVEHTTHYFVLDFASISFYHYRHACAALVVGCYSPSLFARNKNLPWQILN